MFSWISFDRICLLLRNAAFVVAGLIWLAVLFWLPVARSWNYDELSHAHMAWLLSVGEVPYRDFTINHFPFFWIPVAALLRTLPESPATLMDLRHLALLLNLTFIASLWMLSARELPRGRRLWAAACFAPVLLHPATVHFLIEFRPDALANAMLFVSLAWLAPAGRRWPVAAFLCGLLAGAAVLVNTKYVLFPFILGPVALIARVRGLRQAWPAVLASGLGFAAAFACGYFQLRRMGIVPGDAWHMVMTYNAAAEKARTFGFGLAHSVAQLPFLLAYILCGLAACGYLFWRERRPPGAMAVAILIFLVFSVATNTRPWKQYAMSWYLLAAWFPARALPEFLAPLNAWKQAAVASVMAVMLLAELTHIQTEDPNGSTGITRYVQDSVIEYVCKEVPRDGFVVAGFPLHPVFRRDTFFKVVIDMTADGGDGMEQIMPQLTVPPYSEHFQPAGYEKELELHPPSLVVMPPLCTAAQTDALKAYLLQHRDDYESLPIFDTGLTALERKHP